MDNRTASEKIEDLTDRVARLEQFIVKCSPLWDEDQVSEMLEQDSLRETINNTVDKDCYVTASLRTNT